MRKKEEERECKHHGKTIFVQYGGKKFKCRKCNVERVQRRRDDLKKMAVEYKGRKCQICGYDRYVGSLDFHHIDPKKKDFGISTKGYTRTWERVKEELDKCVMVCKNCHGEIHGGVIECPNEETIEYEIDESFFENRKPKKKLSPCEVCGKLKPQKQRTCSLECSGRKQWRVDWDNIDLKELKKTLSNVEIGKMLGVSDNAVKKRLKRSGIA